MSKAFREYDIALSFAGEDRNYVDQVARQLKESGVRVFYDNFETDVLWGKDLYQHLSDVYGKMAHYTVIFISRNYAEKKWTNHELEAAQARAFNENREYILPARFDETEIPGVVPTTGFVDLRRTSPEELSALILRKLSKKISIEKASTSEKSTATPTGRSEDKPRYSGLVRSLAPLPFLIVFLFVFSNWLRYVQMHQIAGEYRMATQDVRVNILQSAGSIRAEYSAPNGINHYLSGKWEEKARSFAIAIIRISKNPDCRVTLRGTLELRSDYRLVMSVKADRNDCNVPLDTMEFLEPLRR